MPSPTAIDRGTLTIDEVAARLGIDRGTAYKLAKSDSLPAPIIRLGKRMVVGRAALEKVLGGETVAASKTGGDDAVA